MSTLIKNKTTGEWEQVAGNAVSDVIRNPDWANKLQLQTTNFANGYTVPFDGIFLLNMLPNGAGGILACYINNVPVTLQYSPGGGVINCRYANCQVAVSKGDIITVSIPNIDTFNCYIVPYKITPSSIDPFSTLGDYESLDVSAASVNFTCQHSGIINFMSIQGSSGSVYINVNNTRICDMGTNNVPTGTSCGFSSMLFVKKGDAVTITKQGATVPTLTANARWYND